MKNFDEFLAMYESGAFKKEYAVRFEEFEKGKSVDKLFATKAQFDSLFLLRKYHEWLHSS